MHFRFVAFLFSVAILLAACGPKSGGGGSLEVEKPILPPERACGSPMLMSVRGESGPSLGVFEVLNDTHRLWLSFSHTQRYALREARVYLGTEAGIPVRSSGLPDPERFGIVGTKEKVRGRWFHHLPLEELAACNTLSARIELLDKEAEGGEKVVRGWAFGKGGANRFVFQYCHYPCVVEPDCKGAGKGEFVTLAPEDWIVEDSEGDWGSLLAQNFDLAFPKGLELGCDSKLVLTSALSVADFWGEGGDPAVLDRSYEDPVSGVLQNDLAYQLCALRLCMELDRTVGDFSASAEMLANLEVTSGPFQGWSVEELTQEANVILGGCASNYSARQITEVLQDINASFQAGTSATGFLGCPSSRF